MKKRKQNNTRHRWHFICEHVKFTTLFSHLTLIFHIIFIAFIRLLKFFPVENFNLKPLNFRIVAVDCARACFYLCIGKLITLLSSSAGVAPIKNTICMNICMLHATCAALDNGAAAGALCSFN